MTLIHGILSLTGDIKDNQFIKTMTESMQQFAPDGTAYWQLGNIALGANLLKTLPRNRHESNPVFTDSDAQLTIVADARIDNRDELCQLLSINNSTAEALSDVRLILSAYKKWGEQCAPKLIGDFAFAIWDLKTQTLFCCRDVFARRPFYYYLSDDYFIFSSDLDPILALDHITVTLDEGYIADQIGGFNLYTNNTPYHEINCLDAAHFLILRNGSPSSHHYWQPDLKRTIHFDRDEQYVERFLELFTEAIKCRLATDDPVASFISGGLDASSISMIATKHLNTIGKQLYSFCHVLPENESTPEEDEKELVKLLTSQEGLNINWVSLDMFHEIPEKMALTINPFIQTTQSLAKQQGCKVILAGFGGDQIASCHANDITAWQLRNGDFLAFYHQAKALSKETGKPILRSIAALLWNFPPFKINLKHNQKVQEYLFNSCLYNAEFATRINIKAFACSSNRFNNKAKSFQESIWRSLTQDISPHNQNAANFTRAQMEVRYPMFDRRLIEFCLAVPMEQHRQGVQGRYLIRRAMEHILPNELRLRNNKRYSPCPGLRQHFLNSLQANSKYLKQALESEKITQYIDKEKFQRRLDEFQASMKHRQGEFKPYGFFRTLTLIEFLQNNFKENKNV